MACSSKVVESFQGGVPHAIPGLVAPWFFTSSVALVKSPETLFGRALLTPGLGIAVSLGRMSRFTYLLRPPASSEHRLFAVLAMASLACSDLTGGMNGASVHELLDCCPHCCAIN